MSTTKLCAWDILFRAPVIQATFLCLRYNRLTWHEDLIPADELWIKIGGDKGGGTFKMAFEICNVINPNAMKNTVVFSAFEAPDSPHNLHLGLNRYIFDIDSLQGDKWRYGHQHFSFFSFFFPLHFKPMGQEKNKKADKYKK